jgi:transcriptional regulator with XRE-family HTH domain
MTLQRIKTEFGKLLKELRLKKGLTQEKLAELSGIDYKHIQALEYGKYNPSLDKVFKIAGALEIEPGKIVEELNGRLNNQLI